ncbi:MAG: hypothetical protein WAZ18_03980 [Alphaproteobacteria bacterium]
MPISHHGTVCTSLQTIQAEIKRYGGKVTLREVAKGQKAIRGTAHMRDVTAADVATWYHEGIAVEVTPLWAMEANVGDRISRAA